ncbi:Protein RETARDED ROOT GROWTH, mitochondrial [Linum perenne]
MGGWRASASLLLNHASRRRPRTTLVNNPSFLLIFGPSAAYSSSCTPCRRPPQGICSSFWVRPFSGYPSRVPAYASDNESGCHDSAQNFPMELKEDESDLGKIPVKAYFLSTSVLLSIVSGLALSYHLSGSFWLCFPLDDLSQIGRFGSIDLKNMQGENLINVVPPTSRSTNYIVLKYYDYQPEITALGIKESLSTRYMVVFQYGSAVLINIEDHEVESYLDLVRRHASGLLPEMRKDDYAIKEKPRLMNDMQGGPDYIVLRSLDTDSIRIIGSVLGQSIALDYFVSQVDGMVEEFAGINRGMEKTGTFTMDRTTLIKLVGKANSNLADVILKVGLFERSEIAWKDAKYAQIYEYLRDEYEVNQRFGSLDFKLKFVEHNIHFLQEVIQNRRSDLLEWCIIFLLTLENAISIYEIVTSS